MAGDPARLYANRVAVTTRPDDVGSGSQKLRNDCFHLRAVEVEHVRERARTVAVSAGQIGHADAFLSDCRFDVFFVPVLGGAGLRLAHFFGLLLMTSD